MESFPIKTCFWSDFFPLLWTKTNSKWKCSAWSNLQSNFEKMWVHYNQIFLMGRKGCLPDPCLQRNTAIMGGMVALLTEEAKRGRKKQGGGDGGGWSASHNAAIIRVIHTLRSKERPLSGWLHGWGLIRTSFSTEIHCKWSRANRAEGAHHPDRDRRYPLDSFSPWTKKTPRLSAMITKTLHG